MTRDELCGTINEVLHEYPFPETYLSCERYGSGHINDTFLVVYTENGGTTRYIVQRINTDVFKRPDELMENIYRVTTFLAHKIQRNGGNVMRETMNIVKTGTGDTYCRDRNGSCWRVYNFVNGALSYDTVRSPDDFYNAAYAFGMFQNMLSDFPAASLYETIPDFHNTPCRYRAFEKAVADDVCGRSASVRGEIDFYKNNEQNMQLYMSAHKAGKIPLRVTHNDTKLNNVLLDDVTGKGICVIDLDTVMPGFAGFDFGDLIRFGANTAAEDERDLSKVSLDLSLFDVCAKGFLSGCRGSLTETEIRMLPDGAMLMMLECGMRFLTDYLNGDVYFKIHRKEQNLDRCRTQIKLVREFELKRGKLDTIIERIS